MRPQDAGRKMRLSRLSTFLFLAAGAVAHAQTTLSGSSVVINGQGPNTFSNDGGAPRVTIFPVTPTAGDPYTSPDSLQVGGSAEWASGQLTIRGAPYGYFDTGALLSMVTTDAPLVNMRAGIEAGYNAGPSVMANSADFDMVSLYNQTNNVLPRVTASAAIANSDNVARTVSYTATTINFSPALSSAQLGLLRRSMWVITNSIDLRVTASSFTLAAADLATISNGDGLTVSSTGALPAGVTAGQTYYATIEYGNLYLAASASDAAAGVPVPMTASGSGSITVTDTTTGKSVPATFKLFVAPTTTLPFVNYYGSTIKSWATDGTSITVAGWTVPGQGNGASGQVPPVAAANLDKVHSSYNAPAVFIGAPTKAFLNNWVQIYSPDPSSAASVNNGAPYAFPQNHDSQIHQFEGLELDQINYGTLDYDASFHGLTIGYSPLGVVGYGTASAHPVQPTSDSYDLLLAGEMPTLLKFNEMPTANVIQATSLLFKGNNSVSASLNSRSELMETSKLIDYNNMRLMTWLQRDAVGTGVNYGSMRVGLMVDGTQGNFDGTLEGQIVFSPPGYSGGIGFCGFSTHCNLYVQGDNNVSLGNSSTLILRTPSGGIGGTINSDAQGDTVIGTQTAGGSLVASNPIAAQSGINVTGNANVSGGLTAGVATINNSLTANAIYSKNQIEIGKSASLWFQTSTGSIAGTLNSDDAGDVLFGTQVGGGSAISTVPLVAQNGLNVTGNANVSGGLTAGVATVSNSLTANAIYSKNQIEIGKSASLWFQTSTGSIAGTFSSDDAGDVLFGTQVGGGSAISTIPFVARNGLSVTGGNATFSNNLTANAIYSTNQIVIGKNSGLLFQTSAGGTAGTISSDNAGDVNLGTQVAGGSATVNMPMVATQGLQVTGGSVVSSVPVQLANYSYASLPATGTPGAEVFCKDCLKPSETAGAGTGMLVVDDGHSRWITTVGTVAAH